MKTFKKLFCILLILIINITAFSGCLSQSTAPSQKNKSFNGIKVHYINVGQGDSILVQVNNKNLLIDAGPEDASEKLLSYLSKQNIKKFDYVVATHPHEDHIGGMSSIIKKYKIDMFYAPKKTTDTKTFENMINALSHKKMKINIAKAGVTLDLGNNVICEMIAPNKSSYESLNNYSAVIMIKYGSSKFLFMGDAEKLSEKEILSCKKDISCDVLKIGHHGSNSATSKAFLSAVSPSIAVISCGKNNDYGHPHNQTLSALKEKNIKVYRTDINNTIIITSNGKNINVI